MKNASSSSGNGGNANPSKSSLKRDANDENGAPAKAAI